MSNQSRSGAPWPIRLIEVLGIVGIIFWLFMIVRALMEDASSALGVVIVGLVLGSAHLMMSVGASRRSKVVYYAIAFILVGDSALAIWVDPQALALVLFTLVLAGLGATSAARSWLRTP
jgi:hypothetical protein